MAILDRECAVLQIPIAAHKQDGPTAVIIFLGILIDTIKGELCLPTDTPAGVGGLQNLLLQRAGIPDQSPQPCMQGGEAGALIPQAHDRSTACSAPPAALQDPNQAECWVLS